MLALRGQAEYFNLCGMLRQPASHAEGFSHHTPAYTTTLDRSTPKIMIAI